MGRAGGRGQDSCMWLWLGERENGTKRKVEVYGKEMHSEEVGLPKGRMKEEGRL